MKHEHCCGHFFGVQCKIGNQSEAMVSMAASISALHGFDFVAEGRQLGEKHAREASTNLGRHLEQSRNRQRQILTFRCTNDWNV